MRHLRGWLICAIAGALGATALASARGPERSLGLTLLGRHETSVFAGSASEIPAYDPGTRRLFVVNFAGKRIDVLDIADPAAPSAAGSIDVSRFGSPNSVAVRKGIVAVAIESDPKTDPGTVAFYTATGEFLSSVRAGALPDMLTFTHDGRSVLVANEGEPSEDYTVDPEGSVTVIDVRGRLDRLTQADVRTADFRAFDGASLDPSVRIYGPGASVAEDLEPEYVAVDEQGKTAWVTLQENNAIAELDVRRAVITGIHGLGFKDHSQPGNGLDASDRDSAIRIATWPVNGMFQPDTIAAFRAGGSTYLALANEGDARDWDAFAEE